MPRISAFFGIVIRMFYNDHSPPHFHAEYGEHEAVYKYWDHRSFEGQTPLRNTASWRVAGWPSSTSVAATLWIPEDTILCR